ncbi:MAG: lysylphosphatidylglycerol synthase domain-containing protein [Candidatus Cloacimonetes bacterium]|nr:lysylphosphatidylglycerol synthase domain-containing protein [Candidatus Cloacimonadota bacterium]HPF09363.1 lysylphosphatidylglycerol synthase domain-containing protein [Candidatus Cloacimonadota bacterium]
MFERIQELKKKRQTPWGKALGYVFKLGLSVLILALILKRIDPRLASELIFSLPKTLLLQVFLLSCLRHYVQLNNWRFALHLNPLYQCRRRELLASYLVALPLRFLLPGGHASFGKVFFVRNSSRLATLISTTTERLFMTWSTWTFASIAVLWYYPEMNLVLRLAMLIFAALMPLFAALIIFWVPRWRCYHQTYLVQAPKMMLLQVANTLIMYLQYYLVLNQMGVINLTNTWIGISLTNVSNSIPITISGLGLREGFAIHFLKDFSFSAEQAVAATLSVFLVHDVIPAVVGAVVLVRAKKV